MKVEITAEKPVAYRELWPGQYDIFSHFEYVCGIPSALFLITTVKENGLPNVNFHAWSSFSGDRGGFFAVMPGLCTHTHTFRNIQRDREFCVNFVRPDYYDAAGETIRHNRDEDDEIAAGGFTAEPCRSIGVPRLKEAFLCLECRLHSISDLSGEGLTALVIGRVVHAAVEAEHYRIDRICGPDGFMFNIHSPKNPETGEGATSAVAVLNPVRLQQE